MSSHTFPSGLVAFGCFPKGQFFGRETSPHPNPRLTNFGRSARTAGGCGTEESWQMDQSRTAWNLGNHGHDNTTKIFGPLKWCWWVKSKGNGTIPVFLFENSGWWNTIWPDYWDVRMEVIGTMVGKLVSCTYLRDLQGTYSLLKCRGYIPLSQEIWTVNKANRKGTRRPVVS